jgi:hypothetical protein
MARKAVAAMYTKQFPAFGSSCPLRTWLTVSSRSASTSATSPRLTHAASGPRVARPRARARPPLRRASSRASACPGSWVKQ